jgi:DNA repair protein RecN (Recombination protein N)
MLTHLSIKNYALIRDLELDFREGFTVITGETGTGKSIMLGALDLILGKRADSKALLDGSSKCIVEGTFNIASYALEPFFRSHDLDFDSQTLLRREITAQGKSRAFINDTPVNLNVLNELGDQLVDIHSQHQNLALSDADFQTFVLDSYAGLLDPVKRYRGEYRKFLGMNRELQQLVEEEQNSRAEKDYLDFLCRELEDARLTGDEQEQLEDELKVLEHAEEIRGVLFQARQGLENENGGALPDLNAIHAGLKKISAFNTGLKGISERFESVRIELQDLLQEVERFEEQVNVDPARAEEINDRLNILYQLQQKHRVNTTVELVEVLAQLRQKLDGIGNLEERINAISKNIDSLKKSIMRSASQISSRRKAVVGAFQKEVVKSAKLLGMPGASFMVDLKTLDTPGPDGLDTIGFLFNANKGGQLQVLSKVASGGEKSRLMLIIKSLISQKALLPTIIFDEIDTGVSGAVADRVGGILQELSSSMQVIAITHLPQIAGKGSNHYQSYKEEKGNATTAHLKELNPEERIFEIAKLLSGQEVTNASVESARHLLNN